MKKNVAIFLIVFQFAVIIYYGYLRVENASHVKEPRSFGDTNSYFHNASLPISSPQFWSDERPPTTALFWKLVNSDPAAIFQLQLYFSIVCWIVFAFFASRAVESIFLKPLVFVLVLGFSLSRDIFMWDPFLGSESLAISFTVLFLAVALWLMSGWKPYKAVLLVILGLLMVLTRDTYAYLLLMVAVISIPVFWFSEQRINALVVSFVFVIIFVLSTQLAEAGLRPYRAVLMNTALRVFPSEVYIEYFRNRGMPVDDDLVTISRNIQQGEKFAVYSALAFDEDQEEYRRWALKSGSSEYIRFLWFFKADVFQKVFTQDAHQVFSPDVFYYTATGYRPIIKDQRLAEFLYPTRFGLLFFLAANMLAAFFVSIAWREKKSNWYIPLLMILLSYPQAVLVWSADVNDMARHSITHTILLRLGLWLLLFFVLDFVLTNISRCVPTVKKLEISA